MYSGNISAALEVDTFLLNASQVDTIYLSFHSTSNLLKVDLRDGTGILDTINGTGTLSFTLPAAGFYAFEVRAPSGYHTAAYTIQLNRFNDPVGATPLPLDSHASASISNSAEIDFFTLNGTQGDTIFLTFTSYNHLLKVDLRDDTGALGTINGTGTLTATLPATGSYVLYVSSMSGYHTAAYALHLNRFNDPVGAAPLALDSHVSASISTSAEVDFFTFSGTQGDTIFLSFHSSSNLLKVDLRDSTGILGTVNGTGTLTATLPATGSYVFYVSSGSGYHTAAYHLHLNRVNDPVGADRIALDWITTGDISSSTEVDFYTVRASAGATLTLQITSGSNLLEALLVDQTGNLIVEAAGTSTSSPVTVSNAGIYTLLVKAPSNYHTAGYTISLHCPNWPFPKLRRRRLLGPLR